MTNQQLRELYESLPAAQKAIFKAVYFAGFEAYRTVLVHEGCEDARWLGLTYDDGNEFFKTKYGTG